MSDRGRARRRAVAYIEEHGGALHALRAAALDGTAPVSEVTSRLRAQQNSDGSFWGLADAADATDAAGSLASTLEAFRILDELRVWNASLLEATCIYLRDRQGADGGWSSHPAGDESGDAAVADENHKIFVTGMFGGLLGKTRFSHPEPIDRAGSYLAERWTPDRLKGDWHALAAYSNYFANVPHDLCDEILQWCGRELDRGFRGGLFDVVGATRVLASCDACALPGSSLKRDDLVAALLDGQLSDGSFNPSVGDPAAAASSRVEHTLGALVGLVRLG